jgi:hypothetical protein
VRDLLTAPLCLDAALLFDGANEEALREGGKDPSVAYGEPGIGGRCWPLTQERPRLDAPE